MTAAENEARRLQKQHRRQQDIAHYVIAEGTVSIEDIAERFGVSTMTVRRDLADLESQSVVRRSRGMATALASSMFEANSLFRQRQNPDIKTALARAALDYVEPGQSIMLDDSTTGLKLASMLVERAPLTVVTNFLSVANLLLREPGVTLNLLGGQYFPWCDATLGSLTIDAINRLKVDLLVMSTSAVTDYGVYHHSQETDLVKRAMLASAKRKILYVDHTKFTRRALFQLCPMTAFDTVIVDAGTPMEHVRHLRDEGVDVIRVSIPGRRGGGGT